MISFLATHEDNVRSKSKADLADIKSLNIKISSSFRFEANNIMPLQFFVDFVRFLAMLCFNQVEPVVKLLDF